jgi:hypothetical protein
MTMRAGTVADWGGMAAAIEQAFGDELAARKGTVLPDASAEERRMLFAAIARGVLGYLHDNESAMTIWDGTDSFPLQIDYTAESEQSP